jgi:hypothetical protein
MTGGEKNKACPLMPSQRIIDTIGSDSSNVWSSLLQQSSDRVKRTLSAACKVKLFQGNVPKSLSDVLMFLPPPQAEVNGAKENINFDQAITGLLLKTKQLRAEGFPIEANTQTGTTCETFDPKLAREKICKLSDTTINEFDALELVGTLSIKIALSDTAPDENETDKGDEFSKDEHFVKTFSHINVPESEPSSADSDSHTTQERKIFALDCEMVNTSMGPELARVSVIMFTGHSNHDANGTKHEVENEESSTVVLDELVKPR